MPLAGSATAPEVAVPAVVGELPGVADSDVLVELAAVGAAWTAEG